MQNIDELVEIIKRKNFDGVINVEEVERLQSWVDNNRHYAYEKNQIELIRIIDIVIKTRKIEEKDRKLILYLCEGFLKESDSDFFRIRELKEIVEGLVCDDRNNRIEILQLQEWIEVYGNSIREQNSNLKIFEIIDAILENGIITVVEQIELLDKINIIIKNQQFEYKLSYLCKLVKDKKNIGIDLIDILKDESAMQEIHRRAETYLLQAISSYIGYCENQEVIVVSLVIIAMLEYDGNYYDSVREIYRVPYYRYSQQKVEGKIRSILSRYKRASESGSRSRIINVALENAIVPQAFLSAFFEFIFDIYKLNFEYDLPEDAYEDFRFVFEGLRNSMLSEGDDILVNVTQKTYKLIATTKQLIRHKDGLDAVIELSIIIVELIDRRYWNREVRIDNPYLKVGYEGWEKTLKESAKGGRERRENSLEFRSRWEPKFVLLGNSVFLNPPEHRVKSQYDYRDITVIVLNDTEEIYRNSRCDIREIIGGFQINTGKIEIKKPLGKLVYRLVVGDEIIYDSKDKLFRNYIVFNDEGQEVNNNTDFEGSIFVVYKNGELVINTITKKNHYCIGYQLVRMGDALEIGHDVFNFSSMVRPGVFGPLYPNCMVQCREDEKIIPVYHDSCFLVFEVNKGFSKFEIIINGKRHKLTEMNYKATEKVSTIKYVVELDLRESGVFEIEVDQLIEGNKKRILQATMAYDVELSYSKEAINESVYRVHVKSNLLQYNIDKEVISKDFEPGFIEFKYREKYYSYFIPFDFGFYKLSGGEWCPRTEDVWIEDITSNSVLSLYDSECDEMSLYTEFGVLAENEIKLFDYGYYKSLPVYFLNSYKNGNHYVTLVFTSKGKVKYEVKCYNKCMIDKDKTEILCLDNAKKVAITPVFHGKNKVYYEIYNQRQEKVLTSRLLNSGQTSMVTNVKSFREYIIKFHEKTQLLQLGKNTLIAEERRIFYIKEDFVGRSFKIEEAYFNKIICGKFIEKQWFFNRYYVKFTDIKDADAGIFEGQIYSKSNRGDYFLYNINPVDIEICSDVIDGTIDIYMTNQGDGLLFDPVHRGILNSMEHPTAPDIFLYTIGLKGEGEK